MKKVNRRNDVVSKERYFLKDAITIDGHCNDRVIREVIRERDTIREKEIYAENAIESLHYNINIMPRHIFIKELQQSL